MVPKNPTLPVFSDPHANTTDLQKGSTMTRKGAYAAISYMASAVLLVMFNKAALSSYQFPCANVITLFQMVCSCSFLYAMRRWKIISFKVGTEPQSMENDPTALVPLRSLIHTLPLAISYLLYMLVSMESIRGVNVPMYTTIRRTTVAFTMVMEYFLAGQTHSPFVVGSAGIIIFGAVIAGARDLSFDSYGYTVVFASNICTAIYLASIARIGKSSGLSSFGLMWCNGIICTPILLLWTSVSGDLKATANFSHLLSSGFQSSILFMLLWTLSLKNLAYLLSLPFINRWTCSSSLPNVVTIDIPNHQAVMLLSCILAFFLNYSVFLNTTLNSALTQTICGNLKDLFTIGLGWLLFGGLPFDLLNVVGQSLGFLGSCLYAYCKIKGK